MKAIVYLSQSLSTFSEEQLTKMTELFSANNESQEITGYLFYYQNSFFQYLEGEEQKVSNLMSKIKADERHKRIRSYEDLDLKNRRFPSWSMKYIGSDTFPQIGLEKVIKEHFDRIDSNNYFEKRWVERIWGSVTRLADLQSRLANRKTPPY